MRPVVTVEEMREIDRRALVAVSHDELVGRAGWALARHARRLLGASYGKRVVVLAGKGSNGADGRVAAEVLRRRGVRVLVLDAAALPAKLPPADLVIDAAYGTGFRGTFEPPALAGAPPVLACDIPSGVDGDTGEVGGAALHSDATVTFGCHKPGLLLGEGRLRAGEVHVEPIGLPASEHATAWLVEDGDATGSLGIPGRAPAAHKYASAVGVVAGSPGMEGAARLVAEGALRAGAGYVRLASPGSAGSDVLTVTEAVGAALPAAGWGAAAVEAFAKAKAVALGPGLGRSRATVSSVAQVLAGIDRPAVVDADALDGLTPAATARPGPTVLTPHDGEYERLVGRPPDADRLAAARTAAARFGCTVLLKGPTTVVADADGQARFVTAGDSRLATAGAGDVLTGVIAALLARGLAPLDAAALGAHVHGRAAGLGHAWGMVAGDLPALVARWLSGERATG